LHLRKNHGKTGPGRKKADAARLMSQVQYKMALPGRMSLDHRPQITMRRGGGAYPKGGGAYHYPLVMLRCDFSLVKLPYAHKGKN
jgi:hypothetical protein